MDAPGYEGKTEVAYSAKTALNVISGRRIIGNAETHHSYLNLPLTVCSDDMFEIRISGWTKFKIKLINL